MESFCNVTYHFFYRIDEKVRKARVGEKLPKYIYSSVDVSHSANAISFELFNMISEGNKMRLATKLGINPKCLIEIDHEEYLSSTEEEDERTKRKNELKNN